MSDYGVTEKGFVIKRMDTIMDEMHADLTQGFGFDTRLKSPSFLNVLVTTTANQIAEIWETLQDSYYAKYPATSTGLSLDNSVQYGGIKRKGSKQTSYPLHCTGTDGTYVREGAIVATNTNPEIRLFSSQEFQITREAFNRARVRVAVVENGVYTVTINGTQYSYSNSSADEDTILKGLAAAITDTGFTITHDSDAGVLNIEDKTKTRSSTLALTDNLTTYDVTSIAAFLTEEYGKITLPYGIVSKFINNITGFTGVTNILDPTYGRSQESDIELRQSYIAKSALRSNTMIDSIIAELLNNVEDVESASGYENDDDVVDEFGLKPHSVEVIVEGGDETEIAKAILRRKAGGIQTNGSVVVNVTGEYGDPIPVRFNRPEYLYTWIKVVLHGDSSKLPTNYAALTNQSIVQDGSQLVAGSDLLIQLLTPGIYDAVAGVTMADIYTAYSTQKGYIPKPSDYTKSNIPVTKRQKVVIDENRIEVSFSADS